MSFRFGSVFITFFRFERASVGDECFSAHRLAGSVFRLQQVGSFPQGLMGYLLRQRVWRHLFRVPGGGIRGHRP